MSKFHAHHERMRLKTAGRLLLAAVLLFHALLGLLSELHEHTGHRDTVTAVQLDTTADLADTGSATEGHGILHFGHCCGHGGSAMIDVQIPPLMLALFTPEPGPERLALIPPPDSNPYRPPIAA